MIKKKFDNGLIMQDFYRFDHFQLFDLYFESKNKENYAYDRILDFFEQNEIKIKNLKVRKDCRSQNKNIYFAYICLENIDHAFNIYDNKIKLNFQALSDSIKYTPRIVATQKFKSIFETHPEFKEKFSNSNSKRDFDKRHRSNSRSRSKHRKTENISYKKLDETCSIPEMKNSENEKNKDSLGSELKKEDPVICDKMDVDQPIKEPCETQINIIETSEKLSDETLVLHEDVNFYLKKSF